MMNISDLININTSNDALQFLADRISLNEYRGIQVSQHNRYTRDDVIQMLTLIYETVGKSKMQIRTTDLSRRPFQLPGEESYGKFVKAVKQSIGKGTEDSIRKNYFVDFHRMGFIERFGPNNEKLDSYDRKMCKYIQLSDLGLSLVNAGNIFSQNLIYTQGLDNIFGNLIHDFMEIISQIERNVLTLQEYTYFVSFLGKNLNDHIYDIDDIVSLIKEFNNLSRSQKIYVDDFLKKYCTPSRFHGTKTDKRDYHNWYNESQQIYMLLSQTVYFEVDDNYNLIPRIGKNDDCVFESIDNFKRSALVKKQYFAEHNVNKTIGYELHHIVALNFAKTKNEFALFDNWKNLIYIDGKIHSKLSQTGNINNILKADGVNLLLRDYSDSSFYLHINEEVIYNYKLQSTMIDYNQRLRKL